MAPAKDRLHNLLVLLLFIGCLFVDAAAKLNTTAPCLPDQASSLLRLKASFNGDNLPSWQAATDCCHWEGVTCDMAFGRVISLDLSEFDLMSMRLDPVLFNLTSLRNLSLAYVDFSGVSLPAFGFERLTDIIYLNLSDTGFTGKIPIGIACLKNLVTIDLSGNYNLYFERPSFLTIMANMSNLRKLYLDKVDLQNIGSDWSTVLADSVPQLQILSLSGCLISGSIHPSFSSLRTLDLSCNPMLSVRLTYFPAGNNLEVLNLAGTNFSYDTPSSFGNLGSLKKLMLSTMGIDNELASLISELPALDDLQLTGSDLEKPVLSWVSNLTQLTNLLLDGYDFSKSVPTWIGRLTRLESLSIWDCSFSVPIPYQIRNLTKLAALEFYICDFSEQTMPSWIGNLTKLTSLSIYYCSLSGPIPSTIGNLIQLEELVFWDTDISGKIPKSLFALPVLQQLRLVRNQLVGSLEDIPAPLSSPMREMDLRGNQLTGPIPKSLFQLTKLERLHLARNQLVGSIEDIPAPLSSLLLEIDLRGNQLTGPIPKSLFQLTNLEYLDLGSNKLTGTIELGSIWRLKNLIDLDLGNNMISLVEKEGDTIFSYSLKIRTLYLASCNLTKFPESLKYLDTIQRLDLSNNQIEGAIPSWLWEKPLVRLNLSHNMFTTLERSPTFQMTDLDSLDLSFNRIQGSIPIPSTPSYLVLLDYSNNDFSTMEPNFGRYLRNAIYINLSKNKLSGHVPLSFCSLNQLKLMDLSYNNFSGPIPSCLMERVDLSILKLRGNKLHGVLPENIREGCKLQTIDFNENQIEGALPRSLAKCQDLEVLDVGSNHIVDSFPSWMGTLPKLQILVLRSNKLYGTIRDLRRGYQHFTSLQIVDLASNHFSGDLHSEWFENFISMMNNSNDEGQILEHHPTAAMARLYQDTVTITFKDAVLSITKILRAFKVIDLSNNSFEGSIPSSIGRLASLHGLNMSHNNFTGEIPSQLGKLTRKNTAGKPILVISQQFV
ncbi:hypothetical protein SETIT_2G052500v2 [Setaria italica]|uniref:Uncharacterized protein n=1 Tax=Setaria italica TaxID=4555 RepID=A0A368PWB0_SETIT|nr:LRR receptor-like serine/threonine-protein kinase GSO2 isoform X2 [Setaria italica]RCV09728.1 hypothetical protein SETIT_2G052500v2 [Setaria italica]